MCTRYYMELSPELRPIIEAAARSALAERMTHKLGKAVRTEGEVRPTDIAPVIATSPRGMRAVYPMIWGFVLPDTEYAKRTQLLINARSESAHWKPTFRESWERRRCVVPASCYFEWDHIPYVPVDKNGSSGRRAGHRYAIQPKEKPSPGLPVCTGLKTVFRILQYSQESRREKLPGSMTGCPSSFRRR